MSPGFTPRPWLSGRSRSTRTLHGVAGVYAPALVERSSRSGADGPDRHGVAGVYAPALVERRGGAISVSCPESVSPGFTPRPWLSDDRRASLRLDSIFPCVAGVYAPALVERIQRVEPGTGHRNVSPGFTPRPWLSDDRRQRLLAEDQEVSPGFTPRPWLSVLHGFC